MLLNGAMWSNEYLKLLTIEDAKQLMSGQHAPNLPCKLTTIADVICDIHVKKNFF